MSLVAPARLGLCLGFILSLSPVLSAQAPPNDECGGATTLSLGSNGPFDSTGATTSSPAFPCSIPGGQDVWHTYVALCTGMVTLETCGSSIDTVIELFDGPCGTLNSLACNDDTCGTQSSVRVRLNAGTRYYLRVGIASGTPGFYQVVLSHSGTVGTFTSVPTGCGAIALTPSGAPTVGGALRYDMTGVAGTPFLWFGLPIGSIPICPPNPCALGADIGIAGSSTTFQFTLPCDPLILGGQIAVQGADLEVVAGSCPAGEPFRVSFTNTIVTLIL